jgi:hypothetical protein
MSIVVTVLVLAACGCIGGALMSFLWLVFAGAGDHDSQTSLDWTDR